MLNRRLGWASGKWVSIDREQKVESLPRTLYSGCTIKHFYECLARDPNLNWEVRMDQGLLVIEGVVGSRQAARRSSAQAAAVSVIQDADGSLHEWPASIRWI